VTKNPTALRRCHNRLYATTRLHILPRASESKTAGMHDGVIKIRIAAPAVENTGILALLELVADEFGVATLSTI
jgi:uncharacterized protein